MRCKYSVIKTDGIFYSVVIEKKQVCLEKNGKKEVLDAASKQCFNTLISLFSLKEEWEKEDVLDYQYAISFQDDKEESLYKFSVNKLPNNWSLFIGFISRLVGDSI